MLAASTGLPKQSCGPPVTSPGWGPGSVCTEFLLMHHLPDSALKTTFRARRRGHKGVMNQASNILSVGGHHLLQERARELKRKHDLASTNALQPRSSGTVDLGPACRSTRSSFALLGSLASAITAMPKKIPTGSFMYAGSASSSGSQRKAGCRYALTEGCSPFPPLQPCKASFLARFYLDIFNLLAN